MTTCPTITAPVNGAMTSDSNTIGTMVMFTCNAGYTLVGYSEIACHTGGTWSGQVPMCVRCKQICNIHNVFSRVCKSVHGESILFHNAMRSDTNLPPLLSLSHDAMGSDTNLPHSSPYLMVQWDRTPISPTPLPISWSNWTAPMPMIFW